MHGILITLHTSNDLFDFQRTHVTKSLSYVSVRDMIYGHEYCRVYVVNLLLVIIRITENLHKQGDDGPHVAHE